MTDVQEAQEKALREFTRLWCRKDNRLAALSYFLTFGIYLATFFAALAAVKAELWLLAAVIVVVNSFAAVRAYVLEHDCGHYSLFQTRRQNDWAGIALSFFTLTPYRAMQYNHNRHHGHLGDLDMRDTGEIYTMTVAEWEKAGPLKRTAYRILRNPLFLLPIGGTLTYAIRYRWPKNTMKVGWKGVMVQNLGLAVWLGVIWLAGGWAGLALYGVTIVVSAILGVAQVYLQHNFEHTYWDRKPTLKPRIAALKGSSALNFGHWWDIATGNIAYHDLHHFNANIPSYRLRKCHQAAREQFHLPMIEPREALYCFSLKLWDEEKKALVPFPNAVWERARPVGGATA
ncbi:fatty acid desaturase [Pseudoroseicyclus sp. CXY001]|uniref:fatty acid desaturase n=1 Tax=Pseudoroseicyclus sp. CXY001 TaxID=3242492 RepID=UPI0035710B86